MEGIKDYIYISFINISIISYIHSNVVDIFHKVEALPTAGQKGYFQNPTQPISAKLIGGVTLNHLSWARLLGTPTSLLALQGDDENGILIRNKLKSFDIGINTINVSHDYCTSISHIFLDQNGERSIMMAPGSTSTINKETVNNLFLPHFQAGNIALFSTEISQVPLSGVIAMLDLCTKFDIPSFIDIDVPPSIATTDANLGSMSELQECLDKVTMIKPTLEAAIELLGYGKDMNNKLMESFGFEQLSKIADEMKRKYTECKMFAITNGKQGGIIFNDQHNINIETLSGIQQIDATGAGDAFFGGLIAGIYHYGMPETPEELQKIGNIAKCTGAACVEVLGALPKVFSDKGVRIKDSKERLLELNADLQDLMDVNPMPDKAADVAEDGDIVGEGVKVSSVMNSILLDCEALTKMFNKPGLDAQIELLVKSIHSADRLFVTGIGKSGIMAQRMAASLSSIGYGAEFVNGSDWIHGDIGKLRLLDGGRNLVIAFSASGKTRELYEALAWVNEAVEQSMCKDFISIVGVFCVDEKDLKVVSESDTWMGEFCHDVVCLGSDFKELMGCVPSRSVIIQEAFINAVMTLLNDKKPMETMKAFKMNHPGGNIGKILKDSTV